MSESDSLKIFNKLQKTLSWSKKREYRGYSKHDALNSQFLNAFTLRNKFLRLAAIQFVTRAPFNIRPLLGVTKELNPKGLGLFAHAFLDSAAFLQYHQEVDVNHLKEYSTSHADRLLTWLDIHPSPWTMPEKHRQFDQLAGKGWGYPYPWQDWGFFQPRDFPNRVVTCWIAHAFLRGYEVMKDEKFLRTADQICTFLLGNPKRLFESEEELCLSYLPVENMDWAVMDVSALAASVCARTAFHTRVGNRARAETRYKEARRMMNFVVDKQTDYGAWYYTWPSKASHIKHDNYHTGIILDALADYMLYSENHAHAEAYEKGLVYYRDHLFGKNGAPRWMSNRGFPQDIHGAAAGILAFSRAARYFKNESPQPNPEKAEAWLAESDKVRDWALQHMYNRNGYFYYQKTRLYKKNFCLMRWCNAWMCRALAQNILVRELLRTNAPSLTAAHRW